MWTRNRRLLARFTVSVEQLEARELLSNGPFSTPKFRAEIRDLMRTHDLPQFSLAARIRGQDFAFSFTNRRFSGFQHGQIPKTTPDSLFRVASVTKVFTATAIMKEVQDGQLSLSDRAFQLLGFFDASGKPIPHTGYDPVTGARVTYTPAPELDQVTIQSLLNMSSGLPQSVPVESSTFRPPKGKPHRYGSVLDVAGSYAALSFSRKPPYTAPALAQQQISYYVYTVSRNNIPLDKPGTYAYNDTGYALLGVVANAVSEHDDHLPHLDYLQQEILTPLGISPPTADPAPFEPMAAIAGTLESQRYPTEVTYYANRSEPPTKSIFPDPLALAPPFTPPGTVAQPYGGKINYPSHFGNGGLTATSLALVKLFNGLFTADRGQIGLPLSPATVQQMVNPKDGTPVPGRKVSWWGLGWQVFPVPDAPGTPGNWVKNGGLPGTSSLLFQGRDGTTWAYILNEHDGDQDGTFEATHQTVAKTLKADIQAAIKAWIGSTVGIPPP
jgi:CubicO group peptidase (beta-lactamase class C family)